MLVKLGLSHVKLLAEILVDLLAELLPADVEHFPMIELVLMYAEAFHLSDDRGPASLRYLLDFVCLPHFDEILGLEERPEIQMLQDFQLVHVLVKTELLLEDLNLRICRLFDHVGGVIVRWQAQEVINLSERLLSLNILLLLLKRVELIEN